MCDGHQSPGREFQLQSFSTPFSLILHFTRISTENSHSENGFVENFETEEDRVSVGVDGGEGGEEDADGEEEEQVELGDDSDEDVCFHVF